MSTLYKVYDGLGNLVVSTSNFDLAWDVGMSCDLKNGAPRLAMEYPAMPVYAFPFEAVS